MYLHFASADIFYDVSLRVDTGGEGQSSAPSAQGKKTTINLKEDPVLMKVKYHGCS